MNRRREKPDPLSGALVEAARACGSAGPVEAAVLAQGPDVQPLLEAYEGRRWAEASRSRAFDPERDNVVLYVLRGGAIPVAVAAVLDPLEPYADAQLTRPPTCLTDAERTALAGLALDGWKPLGG